MPSERFAERQAWANCLLTDIFIAHLEETLPEAAAIDYQALFRGLQGFEMPADPRAFLKDHNTWVPLIVLKELSGYCERASGRKDFPYHAARAYFDPAKKHLPSLLEIVARVLNDVRSVAICSHLWGAVLFNGVKLQSFERPGRPPELFILAQFAENVRPTTTYLLRGFCEGFPRMYPFIADVQCLEEFSQLRFEDALVDFPEYAVRKEGEHLSILHRSSDRPVVVARRTPLRAEVVPLAPAFRENIPDPVVPPRNGQLHVLTHSEERDPGRRSEAAWVYRVSQGGVVAHENLVYPFSEGQIYGAPYCRMRVVWTESGLRQRPVAAETVRQEVSGVLFDHLKQIKHTQMRMVQHNIERRRLTLENIHLRREIGREFSFAGILGRSPQMQELFALVRSIAETDVTVLIQGETGTGKELIARAIHYNSPRRGERFVAINCGALSETLLESELFGHEKGAFTGAIARRKGIFEAADRGTLFLDEIGETSLNTQVKLLRVLQDGEFQRIGGHETIRVDVRIVAATNKNVEDLVAKALLREDLYYRLNVFPLKVPSLRERPEDIPLLVAHLIEKFNPRLNKQVKGTSPAAMAVLLGHRWPGNVRELENVIQRMMVVAKGEVLDVPDLPGEFRGSDDGEWERARDLKGMARESTKIVEREAIVEALAGSGGNVTRAAKALGVSRATLQNRMKLYSLRHPSR